MVGWQEGLTAVIEVLVHVFVSTCNPTVASKAIWLLIVVIHL